MTYVGVEQNHWAKRCLYLEKEFLVLIPSEDDPFVGIVLCSVYFLKEYGPCFRMLDPQDGTFLERYYVADDNDYP